MQCLKIAGPEMNAALGPPKGHPAFGSLHFIAFMPAVTSAQGVWATLALNIGDFSRYCKSPRAPWIQMLALPLICGVLAVFGSLSAAACEVVYGQQMYQPYQIIVSLTGEAVCSCQAKWSGSPGGRAAMFFSSLVWALSNVTTNV